MIPESLVGLWVCGFVGLPYYVRSDVQYMYAYKQLTENVRRDRKLQGNPETTRPRQVQRASYQVDVVCLQCENSLSICHLKGNVLHSM